MVKKAGTLPACVGRLDDRQEMNRRVEIKPADLATREITLAAVNPDDTERIRAVRRGRVQGVS